MARPIKSGLNYFPLDVDSDYDDKFMLIESLHGTAGFTVIIKMFMKIYSEGYFYKYGEKEQILMAKRIGIDGNSLTNIMSDCLKYELFNKKLFNDYNILTSEGIQSRYFTAVGKKKKGTVIRNYLLIEVSEFVSLCPEMKLKTLNEEEHNENNSNSNNNNSNSENNHPSDGVIPDLGTQIKENKSKSNEIKPNHNANENYDQNPTADVFNFYQNNFGILSSYTSEDLRTWVDDLSPELVIEAMKRAIDNNAQYNYAKSIMTRWLKSNIKTMEDVKASDIAFENSKQKKQSYAKQKRVEEVPEWITEQEQSNPTTTPAQSNEDTAERQRKLDERLAKLFGGNNESENQ